MPTMRRWPCSSAPRGETLSGSTPPFLSRSVRGMNRAVVKHGLTACDSPLQVTNKEEGSDRCRPISDETSKSRKCRAVTFGDKPYKRIFDSSVRLYFSPSSFSSHLSLLTAHVFLLLELSALKMHSFYIPHRQWNLVLEPDGVAYNTMAIFRSRQTGQISQICFFSQSLFMKH